MRSALILLIGLLVASPALADTPAQFAVPGWRVPDDGTITAFRGVLGYSEADAVSYFDLGMFSLNKTGTLTGGAMVFGANWISGDSTGVSFAAYNRHEGTATGALIGIFNWATTLENGGNVGMVTYTEGRSMVDVAAVAVSEQSMVQVGMVNYTKEIETVQVGLINIADNGIFRVLPLVNFPKR